MALMSELVTYLVILELLDPLVLLPLPLGLDGVGPLGNSGLTNLVELFALIESHGPVVLLLVSLRAHALDPLELVDGQHSRVLGSQGLGLLFGIGHVWATFLGPEPCGSSD